MSPFNLAAINFVWLPILPMVIVAIAAIVVLLAGVRIDDSESEGLGLVTLASLGVAFVFALGIIGQYGVAFAGAISIDSFSAFFQLVILIAAMFTVMMSLDYAAGESYSGRRILFAAAVLRARHDADGDGRRLDRHLSRSRDDVDSGLRAGGNDAPQRQIQRGGDKIFSARRVLDRLPALRNRAGVRRDRLDQARTDSQRACFRCVEFEPAAAPRALDLC